MGVVVPKTQALTCCFLLLAIFFFDKGGKNVLEGFCGRNKWKETTKPGSEATLKMLETMILIQLVFDSAHLRAYEVPMGSRGRLDLRCLISSHWAHHGQGILNRVSATKCSLGDPKKDNDL